MSERVPQATGAERIAAERQRQIDKEGWTAEHDAEHSDDSLAWAAVCYAAPELVLRQPRPRPCGDVWLCDPWPDSWDRRFDKRPYNGNILRPNCVLARDRRIRQLEKAGALIAAEIDRLLAEKRGGR